MFEHSDLSANYTTHYMLTYPAHCCQNQSAPVLRVAINNKITIFNSIGLKTFIAYMVILPADALNQSAPVL